MEAVKKKKDKKAVFAGKVTGHEIKGNDLMLYCEGGAFLLSCPREHVVRIRSGRGRDFSDKPSYAVVHDREGAIRPEVTEGDEVIEAAFSGIKVSVVRNPLRFMVYDSADVLLFRQPDSLSFAWHERGVAAAHLIEPRAHYFGLGEKTGPLDKRGTSNEMWNTDMPYTANYDPIYVSIPFALVLRDGRAHGMFFDNPCRSRIDVGKARPDIFSYRVMAGELDLYVIEGPSVRGVVERYTMLTGRHPMPPRWALGHHQSRWSYRTADEVRGIAREFRERDIPCDSIHLDIHYMDRYRVFTFHPERFPDPAGLAREMAEQGFRLVSIVDPGVSAEEDFDLYREGMEKGFFCRRQEGGVFHAAVWPKKAAFPDFYRQEVRDWWAGRHERLTEAGIEGVWNDMNEFSCWSRDVRIRDLMIPLRPIRKPPVVHGKDGEASHLCVRNVYGMMMCEAARQGFHKLRPGKRSFVLTRAGYAGVQRHAYMWHGDNSSSFSHLKLSIPMCLNLGLSGVALSGPDIGGFAWNCTPELYARWIQLGAFYPFCRTHTAIRTRRQEPWSFGPAVERIAREYLKLRYRLHPTLYSLVREAFETGAPVLRPLFYEFQEDRHSAEVSDQAMFGPFIMVAPIVKKGARSREVYLPPGGWRDFWSGERLEGAKVLERDAPLALMPIYLREGAIIFMWPPLSHLSGEQPGDLFIKLYPPLQGESSAVLYEDDGESTEYLGGVFLKRRVVLKGDHDRVTVRVEKKEGPFQPPKRGLVLRLLLDNRPSSVRLDGREAADSGDEGPSYRFIEDEMVCELRLHDEGGTHELEVNY